MRKFTAYENRNETNATFQFFIFLGGSVDFLNDTDSNTYT